MGKCDGRLAHRCNIALAHDRSFAPVPDGGAVTVLPAVLRNLARGKAQRWQRCPPAQRHRCSLPFACPASRETPGYVPSAGHQELDGHEGMRWDAVRPREDCPRWHHRTMRPAPTASVVRPMPLGRVRLAKPPPMGILPDASPGLDRNGAETSFPDEHLFLDFQKEIDHNMR
jgi:hypothetical protein